MGTCHCTHHVHEMRGQRTAWSGWFFSFRPVGPGTGLSLSAKVAGTFTLWATLPSPMIEIFVLRISVFYNRRDTKGQEFSFYSLRYCLNAKNKDPWFWVQTPVCTKCNRNSISWGKGIDLDMNLLADLLCSISSIVCDYIVSQESILRIKKFPKTLAEMESLNFHTHEFEPRTCVFLQWTLGRSGAAERSHWLILLGVCEHRFIISLVKWMPEITAEERLCLFTKFSAAGERCSDVQEPEACFRPEVCCFFTEILLVFQERWAK